MSLRLSKNYWLKFLLLLGPWYFACNFSMVLNSSNSSMPYNISISHIVRPSSLTNSYFSLLNFCISWFRTLSFCSFFVTFFYPSSKLTIDTAVVHVDKCEGPADREARGLRPSGRPQPDWSGQNGEGSRLLSLPPRYSRLHFKVDNNILAFMQITWMYFRAKSCNSGLITSTKYLFHHTNVMRLFFLSSCLTLYAKYMISGTCQTWASWGSWLRRTISAVSPSVILGQFNITYLKK